LGERVLEEAHYGETLERGGGGVYYAHDIKKHLRKTLNYVDNHYKIT